MRVFDLELEPAMVREIAAHGERDYPVEACGFVLGSQGGERLDRVQPMRNVQDRYHARDPQAFARTGRDAFRIDELERMRMLESAAASGLVERVLYHSHCDAGAYFSPEDRAMAVQNGIELMPGLVHLVVSIRRGKLTDMAAYRYDPTRGQFDEVRVPLEPADLNLPDLELRAMEGRESARPIRPVAGVLAPRRVTTAERDRLVALAERVHVRVEDRESIDDLRRLELGLLSPLSGFLRAVEARSIQQSGRLLSGTPWRTPVALSLSAKRTTVLPVAGSLIELVGPEGNALGAMGLTEVTRTGKDSVLLAGPVYVYPTEGARDAAETRAELVRRGAQTVLAICPALRERCSPPPEQLVTFDAILAAFDLPGVSGVLEFPLAGRDPWLDAVMAQNLGATHIWVEDAAVARTIEDTLDIAPWRAAPPELEQQPLRARDLRILGSDDE